MSHSQSTVKLFFRTSVRRLWAPLATSLMAAVLGVACGGAGGEGSGPAGVKSTIESGFGTAAEMKVARELHAAVTLRDGRVLVMGGHGTGEGTINAVVYKFAEVYDPVADEWTQTEQMAGHRYDLGAVVLEDGRVLAAGGVGTSNWAVGTAEIWDPKTGTWAVAADMNDPRERMAAVLLPDGRAMFIGGTTQNFSQLASAEIFDPATGTWTQTADMALARVQHTATLLRDGRVLVVGGGKVDPPYFKSAEIYDPGTDTWESVPDMSVGRASHTATLLSDGAVLVVGGRGKRQTAEIYDPKLNGWVSAGQTVEPRSEATATLLPNGEVLVTGGVGNRITTEIFNPSDGSWRPAGDMADARYRHVATTLGDGTVLIIGGLGLDRFLAGTETFSLGNAAFVGDRPTPTEAQLSEIAAALVEATPTPQVPPTPVPERKGATGEGLEVEFADAIDSDASGRTTVPLGQPVTLALGEAVISPDPNSGATATFTEVVEDSRAEGGTATIRVNIRMSFFEQGGTELTLDPSNPDTALKKLGRLWVGLVDFQEDAAGSPVATVVIFLP